MILKLTSILRRPFLVLLADAALVCLCALLLGGCATWMKYRHSLVAVEGPRDVRFTDEANDSVEYPVETAPNGARYISLLSSRDHHIVARDTSGRRDTFSLLHRFNGWYLLGDIFMIYGVSIIVDAATGSWFDFGDDAIIHGGQENGPRMGLRPGWQVTTDRRLNGEAPPLRKTFGVLFSAGWGTAAPVLQVPLFGNHYFLGAGYRLNQKVELHALYEAQGYVDLSNYEGHLYTSDQGDMTTSAYQVGVRYNFTPALFATFDAGFMDLQGDVVQDRGTFNYHNAPYSAFLPVASASIGAQVLFFTFEVRGQHGFGRVRLDASSSGAVNFWMPRFGLQLEL